MENKKQKNIPLSISFNQDYSLFSMGTENGFCIYNTFPFKEGYSKNLNGGIIKCSLSYRSNFLALIGGGRIPKYDNKKVVIYNDATDSIEAEFKFTTKILDVKLKKYLVFIVSDKKIYAFNLQTNQNIDCLETPLNVKGLFAINGSPENTVIAYPFEYNGEKNKVHVCVKNYKTHKSFVVDIQEETISFMTLDYKGLLLATANEKGTSIKIHNTANGTFLQECKRGKEKAEIISIIFDTNYKYIGANSDRKTLHIWKLDNIIERKKNESNQSKITLGNDIEIKKINSVKNDSSFAKVRIKDVKCLFCFSVDNKVIVVTLAGKYYIYKIGKKGGDCALEKEIDINNPKKI